MLGVHSMPLSLDKFPFCNYIFTGHRNDFRIKYSLTVC